jgi:hypothetical protein
VNPSRRDPAVAAALQALAARVSDGLAQDQRPQPALGTAGFAVDEREFADWVVLLARWAGHLRHVGADDRVDGHWAALLDADEALLLARIASPWGAMSPLAVDDGDEADGAEAPEALAHEVLRLAGLFDRWLRRLERIDGPGAEALAAQIRDGVQRRLGPTLRAVQSAWSGSRWRGLRLQARAEALGALWAAPAGERLRPAADLESLRRARSAFRGALERLRERAAAELLVSLQSRRHEPAAALLLAFVGLLEPLRHSLNRFGDRMVDFHVDEVLHMRARPARPACVHLVLQPAPLAPPGRVPAGTRFVAGKDSAGQPLHFRSDHEVPLDDTRVAALATLRLEHDPLVSPEVEFGYTSRARMQWLPVIGPGVDGPAWPVFGGPAQPALSAAEPARFGLAIGSPELHAAEGERRITLTLRLAHEATADPRLQALALAQAEAPTATGLQALCVAYEALERLPPGAAVDPAAVATRAQALLAALPAAVMRGPLQHYRAFLLGRALVAPPPAFAHAAGRLFIHWLLAPVADAADGGGEADWMDRRAHLALRRAARQALGARRLRVDAAAADPLALLFGERPPDRALVFAHLFTGLFSLRYSAPEGFVEAPQVHVVRPHGPERAGGASLQLVLRLPADAPALTGCDPAHHGPEWPAGLPVVQLQLRAFGGLYPFSMLESAQLLEVGIALRVSGLRRLELHNQIGRVDAHQAFQPFGPLPGTGAWLVVAAPELACKHLQHLRLHLRWAGLPTDAAGFAAHYAGYPDPPDNRSFRAAAEVLRDGRWIGGAVPVPLFAADSAASALQADAALRFDPALLQQQFRPWRRPWPTDRPGWDLGTQHGVLRLRLADPEAAFGHAAHAALLTSAIAANLRRRRPRPLPKAPYTPLLEGLSADYRSATHIHLDRGTGAGARLWHLHPFGVVPVFPAGNGGDGPTRLLPGVAHDGQLCIGLRATHAPARVSLLFRLHDETAVPRAGPPPRLHWSVLRADRWQPLRASQLVSDGTAGLLTSGVVVLDLPEGLDTEHHLMPAGLFWLAVAADEGFEAFAGLQAVHAQALCATRELGAGEVLPLPALLKFRTASPLPGLDAVHQGGPPRGGRPAETRAQLKLRTGERLRHRQRASQPVDVERLVLDAFPEVAQVKCFGASELDAGPGAPLQAEPGRVLVAVLPGPARFDREAGVLAPRLNAIELRRIAEQLQALASPCARFEVRNAAYEYVQLRCALRLRPGAPVGATLQRAERALFDHLCPWAPGGLRAQFGWVLRQESIEACLRRVGGVTGVAGLSMLHVVRDDASFHTLGDTAARQASQASQAPLAAPRQAPAIHRVELRAALPWSIVVPMEQHELRVIETPQDPAPLPAGIGDFAVGRTFIVGGAAHG